MNSANIRNFVASLTLFIVFAATAGHADTFIVTNTNDTGPGSLAVAIADANSATGPDDIVFNIPLADPGYDAATGVWTIAPLGALPDLTDDGTVIDGTTQALFIGADTNPLGPEIEIDGSNAGTASGFVVYSAYNVIEGLVINRFEQFGITIENLDAHYNSVRGNYVGTDATGSVDLGNGFSGILIYGGATNNTIGGTTEAARNLASGNGWSGVEIQSWDSADNLVVGNFIGTDITGAAALGNDQYGISIWSGASHNVIGGPTAAERNLVSGNIWSGISIIAQESEENTVQGNYVGSDVSGTILIPNQGNGIEVGGNGNVIGGLGVGEANLVVGSGWSGVAVFDGSGNVVSGNFIGTNADGAMDLGNHDGGVMVLYSAVGNTIGPGNLIAFNDGPGIRVTDETCYENTITENAITANAGLGIVTQNGGNTELAPPVIAEVTGTSVSGTAVSDALVEIFSDPDDEGRNYEGTALADASGMFTWLGSVSGPHVTATATDPAGNTSAFSASLPITGVADQPPGAISTVYALQQNYPNPFNPQTTIAYRLPRPTWIDLSVYDTAGRLVTTLVAGWREAGDHTVIWKPAEARAGSGVYYYRLDAGEFSQVRKALIVK